MLSQEELNALLSKAQNFEEQNLDDEDFEIENTDSESKKIELNIKKTESQKGKEKLSDEELDESNDLIHNSRFDKQIPINCYTWSLSLIKKVASIEEGSYEHMAIVMQTHTALYRVELFRDKQNEDMSKISIKQQNFTNNETLFNAFIKLKILKYSEVDPGIRNLHKTWPIPSQKGEQLLKTVKRVQQNPPRYQILGGYSLLTKETLNEVTTPLHAINYVIKFSTRLLLYPIIPGVNFRNMYTIDEELLKKYSHDEVHEMYRYGSLSSHNCASWIMAILYSLNIDKIDYDLGIGLTDYVIASPSIHLSDQEDISNTIKCAKNDIQNMQGSSEISNGYFSQVSQSSQSKLQQKSSCFVS